MGRRKKIVANAKPENPIATPAPPRIKGAPKLVLMMRDKKTADVHPAEVENYSRNGWAKCPKPSR